MPDFKLSSSIVYMVFDIRVKLLAQPVGTCFSLRTLQFV
jgi:hypothetical protein